MTVALVEPQKLREREVEPEAIRVATDSVGLVSPRSTWESIGADTPQRSARSRSERSHVLAQGADARTDVELSRGDRHWTTVRYHVRAASLAGQHLVQAHVGRASPRTRVGDVLEAGDLADLLA